MGKNQSFCDLSNTDGYSENLSDCDADVESSGGECLEVTDPFGQQNMMGSQPLMDTGNVKSSGPPGTNENTVSTSVIQNIDLSKKHGTSLIKEQEVSPLILGTDGKPLLNLETIKKPKTVLQDTPKETKTQPVASTSTGIAKQGVLVLTQHGKAVLNLGRVKIGKNIKLESSKVAPIPEKQSKQQHSGKCIDGSAPKQNPCVAL